MVNTTLATIRGILNLDSFKAVLDNFSAAAKKGDNADLL